VSQPWDKQPNERDSSYRKFQEYLGLGPRRTATELAQRLGLSQQAVSKLAKRYDWQARAKAHDIARGLIDEAKAPLPPPPPRPPSKPPPPPPIDPSQPVEPEVVGAVLAGEKAEEQLNAVEEYRAAFEPVGRRMRLQALDAADGVDVTRGIVMAILPLWLKALEHTGSEDADIKAAAMVHCDFYSKQSTAATNLYWKFAESEVKLAGGDARTLWGDCAGILGLLQEVYGQKAGK
jgi:hypothetical protein